MRIISNVAVHLPENSDFKKMLEDTGIHAQAEKCLEALKGITNPMEALLIINEQPGFTCKRSLDAIRHPLVFRTDAVHVMITFEFFRGEWRFNIVGKPVDKLGIIR